MKTTTAIQKSREEFKIFFNDLYESNNLSYSDVEEIELHNPLQSHITTSQKDIFSALIEDMEGIRKMSNRLSKLETSEAKQFARVRGFNQAIDKIQDIIRKIMEA